MEFVFLDSQLVLKAKLELVETKLIQSRASSRASIRASRASSRRKVGEV